MFSKLKEMWVYEINNREVVARCTISNFRRISQLPKITMIWRSDDSRVYLTETYPDSYPTRSASLVLAKRLEKGLQSKKDQSVKQIKDIICWDIMKNIMQLRSSENQHLNIITQNPNLNSFFSFFCALQNRNA